ncbi:hypothetical protein [Rubrobacter calidifluminis]|uniref:hypothetical protein n=1 Tax=Rubrobacter calidifluminis TaxID=1392640 RepID=UPI0023605973|nr:hypothetical protein [Rubrobacter calidifluminis]
MKEPGGLLLPRLPTAAPASTMALVIFLMAAGYVRDGVMPHALRMLTGAFWWGAGAQEPL